MCLTQLIWIRFEMPWHVIIFRSENSPNETRADCQRQCQMHQRGLLSGNPNTTEIDLGARVHQLALLIFEKSSSSVFELYLALVPWAKGLDSARKSVVVTNPARSNLNLVSATRLYWQPMSSAGSPWRIPLLWNNAVQRFLWFRSFDFFLTLA